MPWRTPVALESKLFLGLAIFVVICSVRRWRSLFRRACGENFEIGYFCGARTEAFNWEDVIIEILALVYCSNINCRIGFAHRLGSS